MIIAFWLTTENLDISSFCVPALNLSMKGNIFKREMCFRVCVLLAFLTLWGPFFKQILRREEPLFLVGPKERYKKSSAVFEINI